MKMEHLLPIFRSLQDETRLRLFRFLAEQNTSYHCNDLASEFHIHPNVVRGHLKMLENAHLVIEDRSSSSEKKAGRKPSLYRINFSIVEALNKWNGELRAIAN